MSALVGMVRHRDRALGRPSRARFAPSLVAVVVVDRPTWSARALLRLARLDGAASSSARSITATGRRSGLERRRSSIRRWSRRIAGTNGATRIDAIRERPLVRLGARRVSDGGAGPCVTVDIARSVGPGMNQSLFDAHNIVIGTRPLARLGLVSSAAAVLAALLARQARGALAVRRIRPRIVLAAAADGAGHLPGGNALVRRVAEECSSRRPQPVRSRSTSPWSTPMPMGRRECRSAIVAGSCGCWCPASSPRCTWPESMSRCNRPTRHPITAGSKTLVGMLPADPVLADVVAQTWQGAAAVSRCHRSVGCSGSGPRMVGARRLDPSARPIDVVAPATPFRQYLLGEPEACADVGSIRPVSWSRTRGPASTSNSCCSISWVTMSPGRP